MKNLDQSIAALSAAGLEAGMQYDEEPFPVGSVLECKEIEAKLIIKRGIVEVASRMTGEKQTFEMDVLYARIDEDGIILDEPVTVIRQERVHGGV